MRARAAGFDPVIAPMFAVDPVEWQCPQQSFDGLLITSANAIRLGGASLSALRHVPVLAVGDASADAATQNGFDVALVGTSDAKALLERGHIAGFRDLLWLCGENHVSLGPAPERNITVRIVYRSRTIEPSLSIAEWLDADSIIALHSPRAARHFADYCDRSGKVRAMINLVALSPTVADAAGAGWRTIRIANAPNDAALLSAAQTIVRDDNRQPKG
jgi:uroporphyrinogen-III synthase